MRWALGLVILVACGGSGDDLAVHTSFVVTQTAGTNPSPLDPLANQTVDIDVVWATTTANQGDGADPSGCKSLFLIGPTQRTAHGSASALVQTEILDRLEVWDVHFQLCDAGTGAPSITLEADINELNTSFGCFGVPVSAQKMSGGYPTVSSFTATQCSATILDVVAARVFSAQGFDVTFRTGPDELP